MSVDGTTTLTLVLDDEEADPERLEEDLQYLTAEIAELGGAEVDRVPGNEPPPGTRSGAAVQVGTVLIALGGGGATLPMLVALLRDWLRRRSSGSIRLKIGSDEVELSRVSSALQQQVLEAFLDRHRE